MLCTNISCLLVYSKISASLKDVYDVSIAVGLFILRLDRGNYKQSNFDGKMDGGGVKGFTRLSKPGSAGNGALAIR